MFKFFRDFIAAWRLVRNPTLLAECQAVLRREKELVEYRVNLQLKANKLAEGLVARDNLKRDPRYTPTLNMRCENIISDEEANKIIEESRTDRCFGPLKPAGQNNPFNAEFKKTEEFKTMTSALVKHNEKFL